MSFSSKPLTINPIRILGRDESKNALDVWWAKVKVHLKASDYKDLMVKTWTAYDVSETRGCTAQTICGKPHTAEEMSILIGDMLETIMSSVPEVKMINSFIGSNGLSLIWSWKIFLICSNSICMLGVQTNFVPWVVPALKFLFENETLGNHAFNELTIQQRLWSFFLVFGAGVSVMARILASGGSRKMIDWSFIFSAEIILVLHILFRFFFNVCIYI